MPNAMKKSHLPHKTCATCGRPFAWRKKWERCWDEVRHCGERCRKNRHPKNPDALAIDRMPDNR
jgi:hypothetical protein